MYTRNQSAGRQEDRGGGAARNAGYSGRLGGHGTVPVLIPQDYHGEFLRERRADVLTQVSEEELPAPQSPAFSAQAEQSEQSDEVRDIPAAPLSEGRSDENAQPAIGGALLGGLYDLLIGENSSEEETLLLLAIGLLLLWGHLDRGGLFDRSTWDADDLALLLIGYLLLS